MKLQPGNPQTVDVAVIKCLDDRIVRRNRENGLGGIARIKVHELHALLGVQANPLDVVLLDHGMGHLAHLDRHDFAVDLDDGNVLLSCTV